MEFIGTLFALVALFFFVAIFMPKRLLFFISDEEKRKRWKALVFMFVSFIICGIIANSSDDSNHQEGKAEKGSAEWVAVTLDSLRKDSVRLANFKEDTIQSIDKHHILSVAGMFTGYRLPDSTERANEQIRSLYMNNDKAAKMLGKKYFKALRVQYGKLLANDAWESDIDVSVSGKNKDVITFTGAMFAANRNIKEFQEKIAPHLIIMHFKRSCYKWVKSDSEFTYYDL